MRICLTIAALLMSGCATDALDISTGGPTAVVRGFGSFGPLGSDCALNAEPEYGGTVESYGMNPGARELTIDTGPATVIAKCTFADFISWSGTTILEFEAEAGHEYAVRRGDQAPKCLDLVDISDNETTVLCEPFSTGRYLNVSTGAPSAFLNGGFFVRQEYARCVIFVPEHPPSSLVRTDPGEITIKVQCALDGFFGGDIDGVALFTTRVTTDHEYAFSVEDDETICMVDRTSGSQPVSCQPYERVFSSEIPWKF